MASHRKMKSVASLIRRCLSSSRKLFTTTTTSSSSHSTISRTLLPLSRETVLIDSLAVDQHHDAFSLVCDAARRADNIGLDEYPTLEHFNDLLNNSRVSLRLTHANSQQNSVDGLIVISPCRYARSSRPTQCTVVLVTSERLSKRLVWRDLLSIALDAARQLPDTYSACVADVFITCLDRLAAFRDEHFLITACIPHAGKLANSRAYTANYILYKELGNVPETKPELERQQLSDCPRSSTAEVFQPNLLDLKNLPYRFKARDGTTLLSRCMRPDEVSLFYEAVKTSAEAGDGYGVDEIPDYNYFARHYVHNFYNLVTELAETGETVFYGNFGPSSFTRSASPAISEGGNAIIMPKFRGNKWYADTAIAMYDVGDQSSEAVVGYQGDTSVTNLAGLMGAFRMGYTINGVLPKGIYVRNKGWTDMLLYYRPVPRKANLSLSKL